MPHEVTVTFNGGPEDGNTQYWGVPPTPPKTLNWGGDIYERTRLTQTRATYKFNAQATKDAAPGLAGATASWGRFTHALSHTAPKDVRRVTNAAARIRMLTRNHR